MQSAPTRRALHRVHELTVFDKIVAAMNVGESQKLRSKAPPQSGALRLKGFQDRRRMEGAVEGKRGGNRLDSNDIVLRGKERLAPRKKKLSKLKMAILLVSLALLG